MKIHCNENYVGALVHAVIFADIDENVCIMTAETNDQKCQGLCSLVQYAICNTPVLNIEFMNQFDNKRLSAKQRV